MFAPVKLSQAFWTFCFNCKWNVAWVLIFLDESQRCWNSVFPVWESWRLCSYSLLPSLSLYLSRMSVKLRFDSPSDGGLVHRSRSFTGFSSLTGRRRWVTEWSIISLWMLLLCWRGINENLSTRWAVVCDYLHRLSRSSFMSWQWVHHQL